MILQTVVRSSSILSVILSVIVLGALIAPYTVTAQVLEEVTVTAQKREQSIQDVGISVTAFSGDQLKDLGVTNTVEITQQVPALQLYTFTPGFTILNLRGISQNNFTDNLEAPVAVYVDGAYTASMNAIGAQLFDIERVEVLRGPQGTLFGRNATGGLVHYITKGADESELNGYLEASVSEYDKYSVEGAIGGGFTERVRARVAARWETADGYVESLNDLTRDAHGADGYAIRGTIQVDFTDNFQGDFKVSYSEDDDVPSGTYTVSSCNAVGACFDPVTGFGTTANLIPPADVHTHDSNFQGALNREIVDVNGTLTWTFDNGLELVSITNYKDIEKDYIEDADGIPIPAGTPADPPFTTFSFVWNPVAEWEQFSQEVRLSGETPRTRWQVGGYYLDLEYDGSSTIFDPPFPGYLFFGGPIDSTRADIVMESQNWSLFGQLEYDITDVVTVIGGLRWSQDDKEIDWTVTDRIAATGMEVLNVGSSFSGLLPANPGLGEIDYGDYAARLQLDWKPSDDLLLFASFNRGIKGGNWTPPVTADPTVVLKHDEEILLAYEIGGKWTLPNALGRLNATAFYYDYDDYQAFSFNASLTPQVSNTDAEAYGGEIELYLTPAEGWDFVLGASFLDSEVESIPTLFGGFATDLEFPNAPSVSLNWLARYEWPLLGGMMSIQIDGNYNDEQFLLGTNAEASLEDSYSVWNGSLSYTSGDDQWKATLWVKNFTDEEYRLYFLDLGLADFIEDVYAPPRWVGGTVSFRF